MSKRLKNDEWGFEKIFLMSFRPLVSVFIGFVAINLLLIEGAAAQPKATFANIGRAATPDEVQAWDIDVRADFKGLPKGAGSVAKGQVVWEAQCASCHGVFGESNEVFTPIAGGTTKKDIETGRVAALMPGANTPQRTTVMKLSTLSTMWDYINRAMPWTAPKSLTADEVYAVSAYILNLADIVPADFTLSDQNMAATQARLPNRLGKTTAHAMWPSNNGGTVRTTMVKPDVQGSACMTNCAVTGVSSSLPDYARTAHGNLAEQSRGLGPVRGVDTAALATPSKPTVAKPAAGIKMADLQPIFSSYACTACHAIASKGIGPSFKDIAARYQPRSDGLSHLQTKIKAGGQGVWGAIPMPAQALSEADASRVAQWLMLGAPQ